MWPPNRTADYVIWAACTRLGVRPPGIPQSWDDMTSWQQALVLAFHQTADYENQKEQALLSKALSCR